MDPRSGQIYIAPSDETVKAKDLIEIPQKDLEHVVNMNRHERRKWAALQRRKEKAGKRRA